MIGSAVENYNTWNIICVLTLLLFTVVVNDNTKHVIHRYVLNNSFNWIVPNKKNTARYKFIKISTKIYFEFNIYIKNSKYF